MYFIYDYYTYFFLFYYDVFCVCVGENFQVLLNKIIL